ncbi:hypothetical protein H2203_009153 [Taxawa tesnikishii (nom. ined.)]|nr:hypothetical protein H2203_009153 [Dothideales sp. JES 119]
MSSHSLSSSDNIPLRDIHTPDSSIASSDFSHLLSEDGEGDEDDDGLPPVDGGLHAWRCLLGCWLIEFMLWGFPLSFGIFQSYYSTHPLFASSSSIPTIGTLATGLSYLGMPFANLLALRWPYHRRLMCALGFTLCVLGLLGASFATQTWHLLLCQGVLYGTSWVVCYTPFLFMLNEWFEEKRGLAYGILFAAGGVGGLVVPLTVGSLMQRFGFRVALRVFAIATLVVGGTGLLMIKPRIPPGGRRNTVHKKSGKWAGLKQVLRDTHFPIFATAIFLQGLGFFLPNIFLPAFAVDLSLPSTAGSGLLALVSASQVLGQVGLGWISDKLNPYIPTSAAAFISGLSVLFLWAPSKTMSGLTPFAILWGLFSASYSVSYSQVCNFLVDDPDMVMTIYGVLSFERGVANILEGPISAFLLGDAVKVDAYALGRWCGHVFATKN